MIARLLARLKSSSRSIRSQVVVDTHGVRLVREDGEVESFFLWAEVDEIRTFKVDLFIVDDIRLAFRIGEDWREFSEDVPGFSGFWEAIRQVFPTVPEDWYFVVMHPAFATNEQVLYRREVKP